MVVQKHKYGEMLSENFAKEQRHHFEWLLVGQEVEIANITVIWYKRDVIRLEIIDVVAFLELSVLKSNRFPFLEDFRKLIGLLHLILCLRFEIIQWFVIYHDCCKMKQYKVRILILMQCYIFIKSMMYLKLRCQGK